MLNVMRENLRHLKWVLWLVAIAMVASLGYYFNLGGDSAGGADADWAARVDGTPIPRTLFVQLAQRTDDNYRRMFGDQYEQLRPQLQIGRQVVQSLVDQKIILKEAEKLGISASPGEVSARILEDPSLRGPDGRFVGKEQYARLVARIWKGGAPAYEAFLADSITVEKWTDLVTSPLNVTDQELLDSFRRRNDSTEIEYAVVASADQDISMEASEEDKQRWYETHLDDYRLDEGRRIRYVVVKRQDLLSTVEVSDDRIAAYYKEHQDEFSRPEQRRASHVLIRIQPDASPEARDEAREKAEGILERARAGESFEDLARTLSEDELSGQRGGDLGFFGRGSMVPAFEQAAFGTPVGEFAPVTETGFGFHVIRVTEERAAGVAPLDEIQEDLRTQLRQRAAEELVDVEARRLREEVASADDLDAVAEREGMEVEERTVRKGGSLGDLGASPAFMESVFALAPGSVSEPLRTRQGMALVAVLEEVPAAVAPFDEIATRVTTDLLNDRLRQTAREVARAALDRHKTVEKAAGALDAEFQESGNLTPDRTLPRTGGNSPEMREALFGPGAQEGASGVVPVPAGALMYTITRRKAPDTADFEASKEDLRIELLEQRRTTLIQSILDKLRPSYAVEVNEELVSRIDT